MTSSWINAQTILPGDYLVEDDATARWVYLRPDEWVEVTCMDGTVRTYHTDTAVLVYAPKERY